MISINVLNSFISIYILQLSYNIRRWTSWSWSLFFFLTTSLIRNLTIIPIHTFFKIFIQIFLFIFLIILYSQIVDYIFLIHGLVKVQVHLSIYLFCHSYPLILIFSTGCCHSYNYHTVFAISAAYPILFHKYYIFIIR